MSDGKLTLRSAEVAAIVGVSQNSLSVWRKHGRGPKYVQLGKRIIRYPVVEFREWLNQRISAIEGQIASLDRVVGDARVACMADDGAVHEEVL